MISRHWENSLAGIFAILAAGANCLQTALAEAPTGLSESPFINEAVAAEFNVDKGGVIPIKGERNDCRADNEFVVAAMKSNEVSLKDCDYHVLIKKGSLGPESGHTGSPSIIYIYYVDQIQCGTSDPIETYNKTLNGRKFKTCSPPVSEAPMACHSFSAENRIIVLGSYGLPSSYKNINMDALIAHIKQAR